MNLEFSGGTRAGGVQSHHAEASSSGLSESHRQSQSKLRPHKISHPGVTRHSKSPGSEAEEVRAVEMVVHELMDPALSSTILLYHTSQFHQAPSKSSRAWRQPSRAVQPARLAKPQLRRSLTQLSSCTKGRRNSGTKSEPRNQRPISWCRQPRSVLASTAPGTCEPSFKGHPLGRTPRNRNATAGPQLLRTSSGGPSRQFLAAQPGNQLTGGGRRAIRGVKRFLSWLALRYELTYSTALS